jgi:AAA domain, putative AbiEii toxin, Type IV TA system
MEFGSLSNRRAIISVGVEGYKSLGQSCELPIRPLTFLAGANSSGKSSAMQPLLLLKQTLDAPYDPGALLLHDSHVKFTSTDQLLTRLPGSHLRDTFRLGLQAGDDDYLDITFRKVSATKFDIERMTSVIKGDELCLWPDISHDQVAEQLEKMREREAVGLDPPLLALVRSLGADLWAYLRWIVVRERCFLALSAETPELLPLLGRILPVGEFAYHLRRLIHVPGLRGNPERAYRTSAVGSEFPGTFDQYVASVVSVWQSTKDERLKALGFALERLGLTWKVTARQLDASQVELQVGRLSHAKRGGAQDLVDIADVGFGVSQCLPVIVALLTAEPGQLVYLEQPEIHLHPRAQVALAELLVEAAIRGVRVVAETHSALLLLGAQSLVAQKRIAPDQVKLHWFRRREDGLSEVTSGDLDETGAYGDWPEDFGQVAMQTESGYLDTVEALLGVR